MQQDRLNIELRCYAYRRGGVWEAICTDLDVAVFGPSEEHVKRSLEEAIDLHLAAVAGLPDEERKAFLSRPAPWHVRFALALLSRAHDLRRKWRKRESGEKVRPPQPGLPPDGCQRTSWNLVTVLALLLVDRSVGDWPVSNLSCVAAFGCGK